MIKLDTADPRLFQEQLGAQIKEERYLMWAMASCCTIISRSNRAASFPVMNAFLAGWSPLECAATTASTVQFMELCDTLRPSGLQQSKALRIVNMSDDWVDGLPYNKLTGCGPYFQQSWEIFHLGRYPHPSAIIDTHLRNAVCARLGVPPS